MGLFTKKNINYLVCRNLLLKYSLISICIFPIAAQAQQIIQLYEGVIPNSKIITSQNINTGKSDGIYRTVITPTLEMYLPLQENKSGAAVIICPGGSYKVLVYDGEGIATAKEFAKKGVAAFVLKYRLPEDSFVIDKKIAPLQDAQQAIKLVRGNSAKWGIDSNKIGIIGFSAGGHLASTAATHFNKSFIENKNNTSLRPNFLILVYPVISMQDNLTHADSRKNLLGENPSKEMIDGFSNELQTDSTTPPTYLTHAGDDKLVDVDNSINFYEALRHHHVAAEMHIYPQGGHGFIFKHKDWMEPLFAWMKNNKWIN